jgi:dihydroorotase
MQQPVDLVIHGGKVVSDSAVIEASIAIAGETIVAVGADHAMPPARERFDATGLHLLPGAIDSHVHFRDPGYTHKEDWGSGSAAAACGGVTTVFDMPNTDPPTGSLEALALKLDHAHASHVDYGIHALLDENNIDQLDALIDAGATSFKCFMGNTFGNLPAPSDGAILEGFEILARRGVRCVVHAENPSIMARRQARMEAAGRADRHAHLAARPEVCEIEAIGRATVFAEWTGARLHIAHHSAADSLYILREAKRRGVDVTAETCPQYLLLNTGDMTRLGSVLRVNPPIRDARHNAPLWDALVEGVLDMIATDHAPHAPDEKTRERIWNCDCGFPGVETQMPLMLTEIGKGRAAITDYVRWSSVNPAKAWGLYGTKGLLAAGAHADIAMVDLDREAVIANERLHSRSRLTPWNARPVKGVPLHTLVRGRFVMRDRELVESTRGHGRPVKTWQRMPAPAPRNVDKTMNAIVAAGGPRA